MELTFRPAKKADIETLFAWNKALIDAYENTEAIEYDKVLSWVRRKLEMHIGEYQCIFADGKKAGCFHFCPPENGERELDDLYLFPEFQGKGIGTTVIRSCLSQTDLPVTLFVFIKNEGAVRLYEKLGFRVVSSISSTRFFMRFAR